MLVNAAAAQTKLEQFKLKQKREFYIKDSAFIGKVHLYLKRIRTAAESSERRGSQVII